MKTKEIFKKIKEFFVHLIFPEDIKCIFCGKDIPNFEEKCFCEECEGVLLFNNGNKCLICAEPIDNEAKVCDRCQKRKHHFKKAFCPFVYSGAVRNAILGYKDSNRRYLAKSFAKFVVEEILKSGVEIDLITYVPMTKKKEKKRSFNQSKLLAEEIGKLLNKPVVSLFEKTEDRKAQKYLTSKEREKSIEGLYVFNKAKLNKEDNILIVDDIITTASTVNYCAGLIRKKVKAVYVCAVARNKLRMQNDNKTDKNA